MKGLRKITCLLLSALLVVLATPVVIGAEESGKISVDGQISDWSNIEGIATNDRYVS